MKTNKCFMLIVMFLSIFTLGFTLYAEQNESSESEETTRIPELEMIEDIELMKITAADTANFELMLKAKDYDPELSKQVRKYISKLHNNIYVDLVEIRKVLRSKELWKLESTEIPDPLNNESSKDDEKESEIKMIETGKRLTTGASVTVNRQYNSLQPMIKEYKEVLFAYLKYNYAQAMKDLLIRKKIDSKSKDTDNESVVETPFTEIFTEAWEKNNDYVGSYKELKKHAMDRNLEKLINPSDQKYCEILENVFQINSKLKITLLKATFRSNWSEFGSGWIMLIFGVITLYGGLILTFVLDFSKKGKKKINENQ